MRKEGLEILNQPIHRKEEVAGAGLAANVANLAADDWHRRHASLHLPF